MSGRSRSCHNARQLREALMAAPGSGELAGGPDLIGAECAGARSRATGDERDQCGPRER